MSKSAAEWLSIGLNESMGIRTQEDSIQAIINDARAGMVPEGELAELKGRHAGLWATVEGLKTDIESLKAELAKAWEAAATAQREAIYDYIRIDWPGCLTCASLIQSAPLVQPPGKGTVPPKPKEAKP